jgi:hypothetical protein
MNLNLSAQCYLAAYANGQTIEGSWLHAHALRESALDFSLDSLARLDRFVSAHFAPTPALGERLRQDQATQNTAFLLAFYAGEVLARGLGGVPRWSGGEAPAAASASLPAALQGLRDALSCSVLEAPVATAPFAALAGLLDHLYADGAPGLGAAVRERLGEARGLDPRQPLPARAAAWPLGLDGTRPALAPDDLPALRTAAPYWAVANSDEPLARLFEHVDALLLRGRVVWGALVQANRLLFEPEYRVGAPGEVVYDPRGCAEPEALTELARILAGLKPEDTGTIDDPALARYQAHLRAENTRVLGLPLAGRLLPYPLLAASTYFDQCLLPDGMLSRGHLPLLVDDAAPGLVLPLPAALWPESLREAWLAAGEERVGHRFDPRAAHAELVRKLERERADPEPLFREGMRHFHGEGVPRNYERARVLWEQAASCGAGHAVALNNLGLLYEQGLGVPVDEARQFDYYTASARLGLPRGQLNLGRWYLRSGRTSEGLPYIRQAAASGDAEARELLGQLSGQRPAPPATGLIGRLSALFRR